MNGWSGADGNTVVITGATSGLGLAAAEALAGLGADLVVVARDPARAAAAVQRVRAKSGGNVELVIADLASQASIRHAAAGILARHPRVDALVNNAGVLLATRRVTEDGIEMTWAVNHIAPFLLTKLLLKRLIESPSARIVTTASAAHYGAQIPFDDLDGRQAFLRGPAGGAGYLRYAQTKLANVLFTLQLARVLEGTSVTANCFHPGIVATGINRNLGYMARVSSRLKAPFLRQPREGAETLVWLVDSPKVTSETGGYFVDLQRAVPSPAAQDREVARRLWQASEEQTLASALPDR